MGKKGYRLSYAFVFWLYVSNLVVVWDALYMLYRPRSMAGGDLEQFWRPYQTYVEADKRYADMDDGFGIAQSWLNLGEAALALMTLFYFHTKNHKAVLFAFFTSTLVLYKTIIYMFSEACSGFEYTGHSLEKGDYFTFYATFVLPSSFWIIIPFLMVWSTGKYLLACTAAGAKKKLK